MGDVAAWLLAAAPAQTPPSLDALYLLVGSAVVLQAIGAAFGLVRWLGSRTVQREDEDKKALQAQVKAMETRFDELRASLDIRFERQAEFYRAALKEHSAEVTKQLEKAEYDIRQTVTRAIRDVEVMQAERQAERQARRGKT